MSFRFALLGGGDRVEHIITDNAVRHRNRHSVPFGENCSTRGMSIRRKVYAGFALTFVRVASNTEFPGARPQKLLPVPGIGDRLLPLFPITVSMDIGPYRLDGKLILAPMAGVTDRPFRLLCRRYRAALAVSEMVSSNPALCADRKTVLRRDHQGEPEPRVIQIVGADPTHMAEAACLNVDRGAQIVDVNMGCPAKKVCNVSAGSALLKDERLVARILEAVVRAVEAPVTLKIRTGWDAASRNAVTIARIAEDCGIQALTVHGRTRACGFSGQADYTTIREVKAAVKIPVVANGDIDSPAKARHVLDITGADALMIGRGALGRPWLFSQINALLEGGNTARTPDGAELQTLLIEHLSELHAFYGEFAGIRIARKHIGWYAKNLVEVSPERLREIFAAESSKRQLDLTMKLFDPNPKELAA